MSTEQELAQALDRAETALELKRKALEMAEAEFNRAQKARDEAHRAWWAVARKDRAFA